MGGGHQSGGCLKNKKVIGVLNVFVRWKDTDLKPCKDGGRSSETKA